METEKKKLIKDKNILISIQKQISDIDGTFLLNVYDSSNICAKYLELLNKIYKIDFPIMATQEKGDKNILYITYLYENIGLSLKSYNWLIPYFNSSKWWIELEINNLDNFICSVYPDNKSINLTAIDLKNELLFDIENGENNYEYRLIWLQC